MKAIFCKRKRLISTRLLIWLTFLVVFLTWTNLANAQIEDVSTNSNAANHFIGASFSSINKIGTTGKPQGSFYIQKARLSYHYFYKPFWQFYGGITNYKTWSDYDAFERKNMFNVELGTRLYWKKLHVNMGLLNGNYSQFTQDLGHVPSFIQYASIGAGITLPIAKKLTLDLEVKKLYTTNIFSSYGGGNVFEGLLGIQYIIAGDNQRFRKIHKDSLKVVDVLSAGSNWLGYSYSGGPVNWPSDEGGRFTYMINHFSLRHVLQRHLSISSTALVSSIFTKADTVNGIAKKNFNTIDIDLGARLNYGRFFTGVKVGAGTFSTFDSSNYLDRKIRMSITPELGINLKLSPTMLFEFKADYAFSVNQLRNKNDITAHYMIGSVGVIKKFKW